MIDEVSGFDWDEGNFEKCHKHGLSRKLIELFLESEYLLFDDHKHSKDEERFIACGLSPEGNGRYMMVVFTIRKIENEFLLRPISARYMKKKEISRYEQKKD